jgi:hypothetical protein
MTALTVGETGRPLRAVLYCVTILTGAWSVAWPSATLLDLLSPWVAISFGLVLCISGIPCLYGALFDRYLGELIGLPLATIAVSGFTGMLIYTIGDSLGRGTVAGLSLMCTVFLVLRWRGVVVVSRLAREECPRDVGGP